MTTTQPDEFTLTDTFDQPGRWYAVAADEDSFVDAWGNLAYSDDVDLNAATIYVVKDSALPVKSGRMFRMPGNYSSDDVAQEYDLFESGDEFVDRWFDAVAIAESRNARPVRGAADFVPDGGDRA